MTSDNEPLQASSELDEYEDEDEFPPYGQAGAPDNPDIHIKWITDESKTLSEVAAHLEGYAAYCRELETQGWQLSEPVDNSHGFVHWMGEGEPPSDACGLVDCTNHPRSNT